MALMMLAMNQALTLRGLLWWELGRGSLAGVRTSYETTRQGRKDLR